MPEHGTEQRLVAHGYGPDPAGLARVAVAQDRVVRPAIQPAAPVLRPDVAVVLRMRQAFEETMKDPQLIAEAAKMTAALAATMAVRRMFDPPTCFYGGRLRDGDCGYNTR